MKSVILNRAKGMEGNGREWKLIKYSVLNVTMYTFSKFLWTVPISWIGKHKLHFPNTMYTHRKNSKLEWSRNKLYFFEEMRGTQKKSN